MRLEWTGKQPLDQWINENLSERNPRRSNLWTVIELDFDGEPKGTSQMGTREMLVRTQLGLLVYKTKRTFEPSFPVICNNKNCRYQDTLPQAWKGKIEAKKVRCFECNRSFFNIYTTKWHGNRNAWHQIKGLDMFDAREEM